MKEFKSKEDLLPSMIIEDLEHSISPEDKRVLEQWRSDAEANEKIYQEYKEVQDKLDQIYARQIPDSQQSWEALNKKLHRSDGLKSAGRKFQWKLWYQIAAAVLIVIAAGLYYSMQYRMDTVENGPNAAIKKLVLPDGTSLSLNADTRIRFRHQFNKARILELLKGEVFIKVGKKTDRQFIVKIADVEARDIGTSFNVRKTADHIALVVEEGMVALKHHSSEMEVLLTPGKVGIFDMKSKQLHTGNNKDHNYKAWIDKKFIFNDIPVVQVLQSLEAAYKLPVKLKDKSLEARRLTATLHYQTLDSALAVVSASLQCKVMKEKDAYVLSN